MSYDLMVFEPEAAPKDHGAFVAWYGEVTKWNEGHSYSDPAITSSGLRTWLAEMQRTFPDMNSLEAADLVDQDDGSLSDYSIGKQAIYAGFAWSKAEVAYKRAFEIAATAGVGFFDVSSTEESVWMPDAGSLKLAHKKAPSLLCRIQQMFRREQQ